MYKNPMKLRIHSLKTNFHWSHVFSFSFRDKDNFFLVRIFKGSYLKGKNIMAWTHLCQFKINPILVYLSVLHVSPPCKWTPFGCINNYRSFCIVFSKRFSTFFLEHQSQICAKCGKLFIFFVNKYSNTILSCYW